MEREEKKRKKRQNFFFLTEFKFPFGKQIVREGDCPFYANIIC